MGSRYAFALAVAAAATIALPAPAEAAGGSILYRKGGRLNVAAPNGHKRHAIKHTRGLSNPSQDD